MREILFRGKRKDNGEWVYGSLILMGEHDYAIYDCNTHNSYNGVEVIPETVGQYTGMPDKNGNKIFDGDRVKRRVYLVEGKDYMDYNCDIRWNGWTYGLYIHDKQVWGLDPIMGRDIEIISDNPEPLTTKNK